MSILRSAKTLSILCALSLLAASAMAPRLPTPHEWPVERIIANLEKRVSESPEDALVHYNLGRAHAFAFALEGSSLWIAGDSVLEPRFGATHKMRQPRDRPPLDPSSPSPSRRLEHLVAGITNLTEACNRATPGWDARFELNIAWLLETGAHLASRVDTAELFDLSDLDPTDDDLGAIHRALLAFRTDSHALDPVILHPALFEKAARYCAGHRISSRAHEQAAIDELLRRYWTEMAIDHYRRAVEMALVEANPKIHWFDRDVADEGIEAYSRLIRERGFRDEAERAEVESLEARAAEQLAKPRGKGPISPILLSIRECSALEPLVIPEVAVAFDLDGDCIDELWPWIAPETGWLVWDPRKTGEITSGRQLFGSASAWLFFPDGYRVLDALDDDRDRRLDGAELAGIAVWFDRDTDGVSDRGEVVPVEELGIVALATEATERIGASLGNPCGLELADGRMLPTYDWVLSPVTE